MSHEIEELSEGVYAFVVSRTPGWHELGDTVPVEFRLRDQAARVGFDRVVSKAPAYIEVDGVYYRIPDTFGTWRETAEGVRPYKAVGNRYAIFQDLEVMQFGDDLCDDSGSHWESLGSLKGGAIVFGAILLPVFHKSGYSHPWSAQSWM